MFAANFKRSLTLTKHIGSRSSLTNCGWHRTVMTAIKPDQEPDKLRLQWAKPSFNIKKMMELLDHDNHEMRQDLRKFLSDPVFKPRYNIPLEEEREVSKTTLFIYQN